MDILPQLLINALITGSIYALASSGLSLTYGLLRVLNFAHGQLLMVGVYFFYFLTVQCGTGLLVAAPLTLVFASVLSIVILQIFILPFSKYGILLPLVSTLALSTILESLVSIFFGVNVKSLSDGGFSSSLEFWGIYITETQILIIVSALLFLCLLAYVIHSTSFGRAIRAMSENPHAASSLGLSTAKISRIVFAVSTILATYAGILIGYETNMQPTMGHIYTIKAFAVMILGGLGNIWGTIAGAYILGLIENLSIGLDFGGYSLPAGYKDAFSYFIILLILLFKPEGLFSKRRRKA